MNTFRTFSMILISLLLVPSSAHSQKTRTIPPEQAGFSAARLGRIDSVVHTYMRSGHITGAVALIARDGKLVYHKAFGRIDGDLSRPMAPDNIFRILSMTKPLTATAVMMLYEEGRLLLSDPVSKYLPEFQSMMVFVPDSTAPDKVRTEPARRQIQVRHLLNHTSGITYRLWEHPKLSKLYEDAVIREGGTSTEGTIGDAVRRLSEIPLLFHPGEQYNYGFSIDVLGRLVEVVSGISLGEFFRQRIFLPLQMHDSGFFPPESEHGRVVDIYPAPSGFQGKEVVVDQVFRYTPIADFLKGPRTYFAGGAGVMSTAHDYRRFAQMLLNGGELDGVRLLSPRTVELMTTNSIGDKFISSRHVFGDKIGLGLGIRTERGQFGELESNGTFMWSGGGHHTFWVDPKERLVGVMMTQRMPARMQDLLRIFKVLTYQAIVN